MERVMGHMIKGTDRLIGPELWNWATRPGLVGTMGAVRYGIPLGISGGLAATKASVEYVVVKPSVYIGKGIFRAGIELHNLRTGANIAPGTHPWCPDMTRFNWGQAGAPDRPDWMNWFWHGGAARNWGPFRGAGGNFALSRITPGWYHGWESWAWKNMKRTRPEDRENQLLDANGQFDPSKIDKFVEPQSERVYHKYREWMTQQMRDEFGRRVDKILTPRMNAARTHYIREDGTGAILINAAIPNANGIGAVNLDGNGVLPAPNIDNIRAILQHGGVAAGNIPAANAHEELLQEASRYYEEPDSWKDLNAVHLAGPQAGQADIDKRKKTLEDLGNETVMRFKQEHYRYHERLKHQSLENLFEELQEEMDWVHLEEMWLKFVDEISKRSNAFDDLIMLKLLESFF